jgi:hypothetical protein
MQRFKDLLTSEASTRGFVRHLRADFISPVLTQLAPFSQCLSPGETPGVYTARLTAKTSRVLAALDMPRSSLAGVSTEEIR